MRWLSDLFASQLLELVGARKFGVIGTMMLAAGVVGSAFVPNVYVLYLTYGVLTGLLNFGYQFLRFFKR